VDLDSKNSENIGNWLRLRYADGVGPKIFSRLLENLNGIDNVLGASAHQLTKIKGIGEKTAEQILRTLKNFNVDRELALAEKLGVSIINFEDSRYPLALKKIYDPPPFLYVKGTITRQDSLAISIVGSRRCSLYGQEQASRFAHALANAGFTIVSGMAKGIDSAAHRGALAARGRTFAVQGCGLCNIFPKENTELFASISENGACLSEFPMEYEPLAENFPSRNRIIAGISTAVLVIEASENSGSLITAKSALENNREVMAIPGKIDSPLSQGSHTLIKQGAKLVDCVEDIMEALGYIGQGLKQHAIESEHQSVRAVDKANPHANELKLSPHEKTVYECLNDQGNHIEDIIADSNLEAGQINASLISLRLKGLIKQHPGNIFARL
jgi:DNA processing protein